MNVNTKKKSVKPKVEKTQILIRLNTEVLKTLDSYCEAHGIIRGQYITQAVISRLNSDIKKG